MFTSSANVFRIRQAVADLRAYLDASGPAVRLRLAESMGGGIGLRPTVSRISHVVSSQGARYSFPADTDIHEACLLAAALPSDDYPLFTFATSLLLADRLQNGPGPDDLFWNWDSFRQDYELADPPIRAALLNGFRVGAALSAVSIGTSPDPLLCLTRSADEIMAMADREQAGGYVDLLMRDPSALAAGRAWVGLNEMPNAPVTRAVFRYLYERPKSMEPPKPASVHLIPWG